jgi:hypothetical protein
MEILSSFKEKNENDTKPILFIKPLKSQNNLNEFYIFTGYHSTDLSVFKYNTITKELNHQMKIENSCSELKPGICSIDSYLFSNNINNNNFYYGYWFIRL